ncbi:MAG: Holliday junction branch migration protein RuvA, partial [Clostridia bacterium]|nr:Holliday junction branch migration protein RuvA [Clostridia bacterium]
MFYYISGKLTHLENGLAVIDVGGVGYRLTVSGTTYDAMPPNRSTSEPPTVRLYTHMTVREDDIELFGFATQTELASFKMLISVSGVGPKAAMSILSLLT